MTEYSFTIPGRPVPKGRPRLGMRGRKAYIYTPPETRQYEKTVGWVAKTFGIKPLNGPVGVKLDLFVYGKGGGDVDNYCKSILDGLKGIGFEDDSQIVELVVRKYRVKAKREERVEIELRELERREPAWDSQTGC